MTKKIVWVASANPVKIDATRQAFTRMFPEISFAFFGKGVPSEVPDQPKGSAETYLGASNRIKNLKKEIKEADFYVGIEGGITQNEKDCFAFAWMLVESSSGRLGQAQTGHFQLPPPVVQLLDEGHELGHADDIIFGTSNSKQKSGSVGILTDNIIDRSDYYIHALILALIPFKKEKLFTIVKI
jgi:inosine/xanthosine triphosphatase